jgi:hypothetical protein
MNIENYIDKDYNHVLNQLQDYMLNRDAIDSFVFLQEEIKKTKYDNKKIHPENQIIEPENQIIKKPFVSTNKNISHFFYPKDKDSLFWCFYIMKHGMLNYQMIHNKNIVFEKTQKIEYVEKIRKEKQNIKNYKFASLTNIENSLANEFKIDIPTFLTLCVIENINVIIVKKQSYFQLEMNDSDDVYVISLNENDKYGFQVVCKNHANYTKYNNEFFKIDNMNKPLKCMANYKVSELIDICKKLLIEFTNKTTGKNKLKNELYELIIQQL